MSDGKHDDASSSSAAAKKDIAPSAPDLKSLPVRAYLDQTVVPLLLQGMSELVKVRCDWLAQKREVSLLMSNFCQTGEPCGMARDVFDKQQSPEVRAVSLTVSFSHVLVQGIIWRCLGRESPNVLDFACVLLRKFSLCAQSCFAVCVRDVTRLEACESSHLHLFHRRLAKQPICQTTT